MNAHRRWASLLVFPVVLGCAGAQAPVVRPGIDVLLTDSLALVQGRRVVLLTNQSGVDAAGVDDLTRLREAGIAVTAILSPEHGFRGQLDEENIGHGVDSATGIPIFSLYGAERRPTPAMLTGADVLLVDLPDIGARTYTYVSTALLALEAAADAQVPVVILDRPNPIGGVAVQGPMLDTALQSFVGFLPVPLRHGMTLGELVRYGQAVRGVGGRLIVVPAAGWRAEAWYDDTGLPWVRPSPSMPSLESATHYPGLVLFEATNLSVGRGTAVAFQVVGAPWLDAARVARALAVPGAAVTDTVVTPVGSSDGKFDGVTIPAVRLRVTDRQTYDPVAAAVHLLAAIRAVHPDSLDIDPRRFDDRAGTAALRTGLESGRAPAAIVADWDPELARFRRDRERWLVYPRELP